MKKNETKNIRLLVLSFSLINLAFWCFLFCFFMWFARFQILISETQSIWHKLLVLSWLYQDLRLLSNVKTKWKITQNGWGLLRKSELQQCIQKRICKTCPIPKKHSLISRKYISYIIYNIFRFEILVKSLSGHS